MRNKEHYFDPTAGRAVNNVSKLEQWKIKETKRELSKYCGYVLDLEDLERQLLRILGEKEEFIARHNRDLDGMPKGDSVGDPTYAKAVESIRLFDGRIKRTKEAITSTEAKKKKIDKAVSKLPSAERYIVETQYFELGKPLPMWRVAKKLNYSERQCYRLKDSAVSMLSRLL